MAGRFNIGDHWRSLDTRKGERVVVIVEVQDWHVIVKSTTTGRQSRIQKSLMRHNSTRGWARVPELDRENRPWVRK